MSSVRIAHCSDTHTFTGFDVPECDILIHTGDHMGSGHNFLEVEQLNEWFARQNAKHKLYIPGNHDRMAENMPELFKEKLSNAIVLMHETITLEGLKIFGSPYTPRFGRWAFMGERYGDMSLKWRNIPSDTDVLATHGAPYRIMDPAYDGEHVGCQELLKRVNAIRPKLHLFGHLHSGYGDVTIGGVRFVNGSIMDDNYRPANKARLIVLEK